MRNLYTLIIILCCILQLNAEGLNSNTQNKYGNAIADSVKKDNVMSISNYGISDNNLDDCSFCWKDFISDFTTTLIGAFIAFWFALKIYKKQRKDEKLKSQEAKVEKYRDILLYIQVLVKGIVRHSDQQSIKYKEFSENLINKPYKKQILTTISNSDINRIKDVSSSVFFEAFEYFNKKKPDYLIAYKNINYGIDHLSAIINQSSNVFDRYIISKGKQEQRLKRKIEELSDKLFLYIRNLKQTYPITEAQLSERDFYERYLTEFHRINKIKETPYHKYVDDFVKPLKDELSSLITSPSFEEVFILSKEILILYSDYKHDSEEYAKHFKDQYDKLQDTNSIINSHFEMLTIETIEP